MKLVCHMKYYIILALVTGQWSPLHASPAVHVAALHRQQDGRTSADADARVQVHQVPGAACAGAARPGACGAHPQVYDCAVSVSVAVCLVIV